MTKPKPPAALSVVQMPADINDLPLPEAGPYFVLSKHKLFVHKRSFWGRTLTEASEVPLAGDDPTPMLWHHIPKIPAALIGQAWSFFRSVENEKHSEAMVDITWHQDKGFRFFVPKQYAGPGGVNTQRNTTHYQQGSIVVGTIHSHCNMPAFHSGTDHDDAMEHDGLHITIGHVSANTPDVAVMISAAPTQWDKELTLADVMDGDLALVPHPEWWNRQVSGTRATPAAAKPAATLNSPAVWKPFTTPAPAKTPPPLRNNKHKYEQQPFWLKYDADTWDQYKYNTTNEWDDLAPINLPSNKDFPNPIYLDTLLYTSVAKGLTAEHRERLRDALDYMEDIDTLLASMHLQVHYQLITAAPKNPDAKPKPASSLGAHHD